MIISAVMLGFLRPAPLATELAPIEERAGVR
jgi:hypothetical protein